MTGVDDSLKIVTTSFKDASIIGSINCTLPSDLSRVLDYISNYANKNDTFDSGLWEETTAKDPKSNKRTAKRTQKKTSKLTSKTFSDLCHIRPLCFRGFAPADDHGDKRTGHSSR